MEFVQPLKNVQVIVPARNEQDCIGRCLESLISQQGIDYQITLVDDNSSDRTRAIAESFPGVRVLEAGEPAPGTIGKCNALITGARGATAVWLLFTDADTFHLPGSLAAAVKQAEERGADMLSFSPMQETGSLPEMALMPVIFADLVHTYPPDRVNDPRDPTAAVNGQYLLIRREVYEKLGGHAAVAGEVLEDVALAKLFKNAGYKIWFAHGAGLVQTRMYRSFPAMIEGWTKNLALLFSSPLRLAGSRALEFAVISGAAAAAILLLSQQRYFAAGGLGAYCLLRYTLFWARIAKAHFPLSANLMALFGLPLFAWLLWRSWFQIYVRRAVTWKGRTCAHFAPAAANSSSRKESLT